MERLNFIKKGKWYKYEGGGYSFKGEFYDKPTKPKKGLNSAKWKYF